MLGFLADNWVLMIDVLLVAILFYYVLRSVRGTKLSVVLGVLIGLGVTYFLCKLFGFITLEYVLRGVLYLGPLVLVILFAPEIRRVIWQAAKTSRLLDWLIPKEEQQTNQELVEILTETTLELARCRRGGLFVIEGQESVDEYLVTGTELHAVPSVKLLCGLFEKHNPLHDGAVLIRAERIHSAGNFLPISENSRLSSELGTRHRAAVGLSERCDATVIIASEERGEISLSFNGRLARNLTEAQFHEQIAALINPNENFSTVVPRAEYI